MSDDLLSIPTAHTYTFQTIVSAMFHVETKSLA